MKQIFRYNFLTKEEEIENPWKLITLEDCLGMYDWSCLANVFLNKGVSHKEHIMGQFVSKDLNNQGIIGDYTCST